MMRYLILFLVVSVCFAAAAGPHGKNRLPRKCSTHKDCARGEICSSAFRCEDCSDDGDCAAREYCKHHVDGRKLCTIVPLFRNFDTRVILATLLVFCGGIFAASGGIGGGGLFVPIFVFVLELDSHQAIPMSKAAVLGGSLGNFVLNVFAKHPLAKRPLIDYDVTLALEPMTLLGAIVGVVLNVVMSDLALVTGLMILLAVLATRSFQKAISAYKLETVQKNKASQPTLVREARPPEDTQRLLGGGGGSNDDDDDDDDGISHHRESYQDNTIDDDDENFLNHTAGSGGHNHKKSNSNAISTAAIVATDVEKNEASASEVSPELEKILDEESHFPWGKCFAMILCWVVVFVISLLRGGHGAPSIIGVEPCSRGYFLLYWSIFPFVIGFSVIVGIYLRGQEKRKRRAKYHYLEGDVVWNNKNAFLYPALSFFSGVAAGTFGIGGGMIKGPMMVEMGMHPKTISATAAYMILFTASATVAQFSILGVLPMDYGGYLISVVFVSSVIGQYIINYFVARTGRNSIIIFCIASLITVATFLLVAAMTMHIKNDVNTGHKVPWSLSNLCHA